MPRKTFFEDELLENFPEHGFLFLSRRLAGLTSHVNITRWKDQKGRQALCAKCYSDLQHKWTCSIEDGILNLLQIDTFSLYLDLAVAPSHQQVAPFVTPTNKITGPEADPEVRPFRQAHKLGARQVVPV